MVRDTCGEGDMWGGRYIVSEIYGEGEGACSEGGMW